jgi:peptidoglycan/xylan/chitin deacetylase (PgdA/CDA1 family)
VLPLAEGLQRLYSNTLPERSVAITFDDGTHDFLQRAHPLLRTYGFPATVYLTTYYCEHDGPVFPVFCSYLLWKATRGEVNARPLIGVDERWELRSARGRASALRSIREYVGCNRLDASDKAALARRLALHVGVDYEAVAAKRILHLLTPSDVTSLAAQGVDFQLHTHRHRTPNDRTLFLREIHDNRDRIRALTGCDATHFCYPSGAHSLDWLPWLADAGVESATTCAPGLATADANALLLPRLVDTSHLGPLEFRAWLSGVGALLPRRGGSYGRLATASAS